MQAALLATAGTAIALVRHGDEETATTTLEAAPDVDRASLAAVPFENMN